MRTGHVSMRSRCPSTCAPSGRSATRPSPAACAPRSPSSRTRTNSRRRRGCSHPAPRQPSPLARRTACSSTATPPGPARRRPHDRSTRVARRPVQRARVARSPSRRLVGGAAIDQSEPCSGWRHRRPSKRANPRSAEYQVVPCSIARWPDRRLRRGCPAHRQRDTAGRKSPNAGLGLQVDTQRRRLHRLSERQRVRQRRRLAEHPRVRHDTEEPRQRHLRSALAATANALRWAQALGARTADPGGESAWLPAATAVTAHRGLAAAWRIATLGYKKPGVSNW